MVYGGGEVSFSLISEAELREHKSEPGKKKKVNFLQLPERSSSGEDSKIGASRVWRQRRQRRHSSLPLKAQGSDSSDASWPRSPPADECYEDDAADELLKVCIERTRAGLAAIKALTRCLSATKPTLSAADANDLREKLSELSLAATRCGAVIRKRDKTDRGRSQSPPPLPPDFLHSAHHQKLMLSHSTSSSNNNNNNSNNNSSSNNNNNNGFFNNNNNNNSNNNNGLPATNNPKGEQRMMLDMALARCPSSRLLALHLDDPDSPKTQSPVRPLSPLPPPPGPPPPILPTDIPGDDLQPCVLHSLRQQQRQRKRALMSPSSSSHLSESCHSSAPSTASSLDDFDYDDEFNAVDIPDFPAIDSRRLQPNTNTLTAAALGGGGDNNLRSASSSSSSRPHHEIKKYQDPSKKVPQQKSRLAGLLHK